MARDANFRSLIASYISNGYLNAHREQLVTPSVVVADSNKAFYFFIDGRLVSNEYTRAIDAQTDDAPAYEDFGITLCLTYSEKVMVEGVPVYVFGGLYEDNPMTEAERLKAFSEFADHLSTPVLISDLNPF